MVCTGKINYLIRDFNGTFLGQQGIIIPNHTAIGNAYPECTYVSHMNGYICTRNDLGVLQYESIAPDFNLRAHFPARLTYEGGSYTTVTNGWKEWSWFGSEPLNKRFNRFVTIVRYNMTYNLTFASEPPSEMQFLHQRTTPTGNNADYNIIAMYYPHPNSVKVSVGGVRKRPKLLTDSGLNDQIDPTVCGDNIYYYTNRTIVFVVTAEPSCLVRVKLTESIQLTTHLQMNASDFFSSNAMMTNFIDRVAAILQITDTSRVKIVGVFSGSTRV